MMQEFREKSQDTDPASFFLKPAAPYFTNAVKYSESSDAALRGNAVQWMSAQPTARAPLQGPGLGFRFATEGMQAAAAVPAQNLVQEREPGAVQQLGQF